ncbi:MAG: hypothetical protein B6244_09435 [Candidatus Cloacimonetes bacterium 4572_55]|nr:MAG: hypothetical protein B6244_09435 [Candidatus Cloacimonetes bacterium 4572_55]
MKDGYVAIMQPYLFPYIGYFHLIESADIFVFYDDVHYILSGWINRNRLLNADKAYQFTVPISKASQNKLINKTSPIIDGKWKKKIFKTLIQNYKKAPFFSDVYEVITSVFENKFTNVADLAIESILSVYRYLTIPINYTKSSICSPNTKGIGKAERIIQITKELGYLAYVNAPGGKELYKKDYFRSKGVSLAFVKSKSIEYKQHSNKFIPCLSIIDILMFNEKERVIEFFSAYSLE